MHWIFWIAIVLVAWLGVRNLISIIMGESRTGTLKPGQRLCHFISMFLLWGACGLSIYIRSFWTLIIGVAIEYLLRKAIIWSGQKIKL